VPGDPKECREHARHCAELAKQASTADARQTFLRLERSWLRLAVELEDSARFLNAWEHLGIDGQGTPSAAVETPDPGSIRH
jgi:hypothetical protein